MPASVHRRALERALRLAGGEEALAVRLRVDAATVRFWREGLSSIPGDAFLRIVDFLVEHSLDDLQRPPPPGSDSTTRKSGG